MIFYSILFRSENTMRQKSQGQFEPLPDADQTR